jgi:2,5-dihydroxypyridine 5,6-dioxygenase
VIAALKTASMIADLTVEGLMHSDETPGADGAGARILYISDEHPELLERLAPDETLIPACAAAAP